MWVFFRWTGSGMVSPVGVYNLRHPSPPPRSAPIGSRSVYQGRGQCRQRIPTCGETNSNSQGRIQEFQNRGTRARRAGPGSAFDSHRVCSVWSLRGPTNIVELCCLSPSISSVSPSHERHLICIAITIKLKYYGVYAYDSTCDEKKK